MQMKKYVLFLSLFLAWTCGIAQQDPLYSQYINNPFVINPAYAGLLDNLSANAGYRQQWNGYQGSPKTFNANGHISLSGNRMGAGMMFVSDRIGNASVNEAFASYSYRIPFSAGKVLSFGLQAGFANYKIDNTKANPYDQSDPLFQGSTSETKPSFGAGVILKSDRFFLGLSMPRMLKTTVQTSGLQSNMYTQHFYAMGSYLFILAERIRLKPSVLLKMVNGSPASVDLNTSVILFENYSAGVLTRNFNTYGLFMLMQIKDSLRLGYVFEVPTGKSVGSNFITHEITLGVRMKALPFHNNIAVSSF